MKTTYIFFKFSYLVYLKTINNYAYIIMYGLSIIIILQFAEI